MDNMNITAAQYQVDVLSGNTSGIKAVIDGVTMSVPMDPLNRHYKEILRQAEAKTLVIEEG